MPQKDRYHDTVVRALEKDGWRIAEDPYTLLLEDRRLYVDLLAQRGEEQVILVEVKVFEDALSPMTYLASAVGQILLYRAAIDFLGQQIPLYLAMPSTVYDTFLSEALVAHYIRYTKINLLIFSPRDEVIVRWIT